MLYLSYCGMLFDAAAPEEDIYRSKGTMTAVGATGDPASCSTEKGKRVKPAPGEELAKNEKKSGEA